jgi:hypothetical protein
MGVWAACNRGAKEVEQLGETMARFRAVSHCYLRPTYPDWPYNLFTMIHGRSAEDCEAVLAEISRETGITEFSALYSTKEYKKTRVEYFTDAEARWESATGGNPPLDRTLHLLHVRRPFVKGMTLGRCLLPFINQRRT